jgi:hypothetical protein
MTEVSLEELTKKIAEKSSGADQASKDLQRLRSDNDAFDPLI